MKRLLLLALLVSLVAMSYGQHLRRSPRFEVLVIKSEANAEFCNAREIVGQRWGIKYTPFIGCVAGGGLIDHLLEQNELVSTRIAKAYGSDWQSKFNQELNKELAVHKEARQLANEHGFIKLRRSFIQRQGNAFSYSFSEEGKGIYRIRMYTGKEFYERTEHPEWAVLVVDMNKQKVRISPPMDASIGAQ